MVAVVHGPADATKPPEELDASYLGQRCWLIRHMLGVVVNCHGEVVVIQSVEHLPVHYEAGVFISQQEFGLKGVNRALIRGDVLVNQICRDFVITNFEESEVWFSSVGNGQNR